MYTAAVGPHSSQQTANTRGDGRQDSGQQGCHVSTKFSEIVTMFGEGQGPTGVRAFPEYCENCKISLTALAGRTASHSHLTASPMLNSVCQDQISDQIRLIHKVLSGGEKCEEDFENLPAEKI